MHRSSVALVSALLLSACVQEAPPKPEDVKPSASAKAPEKFQVEFETTCGKFTVEATRAWAPIGVDRFYDMVTKGFFTDIGFFRVLPGNLVQFGIHGDPTVQKQWKSKPLQDDPVKSTNVRGAISFATAGPNTRTTQLFINCRNNQHYDRMGFAPFAKVTSGMESIDKIYDVQQRPEQHHIQAQGNAYLKKAFPNIDYIRSAKVLK